MLVLKEEDVKGFDYYEHGTTIRAGATYKKILL